MAVADAHDEDYRRWGAVTSTEGAMDPLSLSAGILAVLTAAMATARGIEQLRLIYNAPAQVTAVVNEVCSHFDSLNGLGFLSSVYLLTLIGYR